MAIYPRSPATDSIDGLFVLRKTRPVGQRAMHSMQTLDRCDVRETRIALTQSKMGL